MVLISVCPEKENYFRPPYNSAALGSATTGYSAYHLNMSHIDLIHVCLS